MWLNCVDRKIRELTDMYPVGKPDSTTKSLLLEYAESGYDQRFVGKTSEPYVIRADENSIEKVIYASKAVHPWNIQNGVIDGPRVAPHAYFFFLINNTPTYRKYEEQAIAQVPEGHARLHTGDDFYYHQPIRPGDLLTITVRLCPVERKNGRHGKLTFFYDEWKIWNSRNQTVGMLRRKGAVVQYDLGQTLQSPRTETKNKPESFRSARESDNSEIEVPYCEGMVTHVHDHGKITWLQMMAWLSAVDEYAPTHYDPDFAKARRYGNGQSIVAGPQMAACLVPPLERVLGPQYWIESYENVQRHPVYPNERLYSFGEVIQVSGSGDKRELHVQLWLVDESGSVRGYGTAIAKRVNNRDYW